MHVPISNGRPTADDHVQNHESEGHRKGSSDVIAAFTTHEHCPAPTAFVRLWSLGSIETLPRSVTLSGHPVYLDPKHDSDPDRCEANV